MGGSISQGDEDWFVAGYEFRQVLARARAKLDQPDDVRAIDQAEALQGLHFDLEEHEQGRRLAAAVAAAAEELHSELCEREVLDERDASFREKLPELLALATRVFSL